jgi:hypothetical protein
MSSSVPAAVDGLMKLMTAVLPETTTVAIGKSGLQVYQAPLTFLVINVLGDGTPGEMGPSYRIEERYSIMCELTSYAGDTNFLQRWTEVLDAWATVTVAIANDPHLTGTPNSPNVNGPVRYAKYTNYSLQADADPKGQSIGCLQFAVDCQQRVTSLT